MFIDVRQFVDRSLRRNFLATGYYAIKKISHTLTPDSYSTTVDGIIQMSEKDKTDVTNHAQGITDPQGVEEAMAEHEAMESDFERLRMEEANRISELARDSLYDGDEKADRIAKALEDRQAYWKGGIQKYVKDNDYYDPGFTVGGERVSVASMADLAIKVGGPAGLDKLKEHDVQLAATMAGSD